ncbi:MAG: LysR family transcriptional regulator [Rhizomicrobium sp.]
MQWDRVRIFLAVARSGQILAAARHLGLNHATVGRQLTALEGELQTKLLERHVNGCTLTQAGEAMLVAAEKVESELLQVESGISGNVGTICGTVRIGAPDGLGNYFLAPKLAELARTHDGLLVQLVPLPRSFSLSRREADIVITLDRPQQGNLIIQKLTDYTLSLYGAKTYLAKSAPIARVEDLARHLFITYVDELLYTPSLDYGRKLAQQLPRRFECGSMVGQMEAVKAGNGIAILHDYAAHRISDLERVLPALQFTRSYWLISHPDTHRSHRVTEVRRHIAEAINASRDAFCPWSRKLPAELFDQA